MQEFKECVSDIKVMDVTSSGIHYTQVYGAGGRPLEYQYKWSQYVQSGVKTEAYEKAPLKAFTGPREEECVYLYDFNEAKLHEERFLKQKGKVEWLDVGDSNSTYFYKTLKRADVECNELNVDGLFFKTVPMSIAANMVRNVMNEEIKSVMFDIEDEKAPGPDGFTSVFFKKGWSVVGDDICNAV
ncbi:hypothetical protein Tco_1573437, partial [Tanacetum coccineum]